ncbi:MAG: exodeoxyribonuclease VII small subunit [Chlorobiota bacterium]|nr:exodeoxyribonuclease VII small subunit [Chlorobiota bacterium]QQS65647.1 MAG: exodeoxyribonuclease VII small subunit [Chlorobiota bacterium]
MKSKLNNFEENITRLEQVVSSLEQGGHKLNDMVKLYEEGVTLANKCKIELFETEQKIFKLNHDNLIEEQILTNNK